MLDGFEPVEENPHFRFALQPERGVLLMARQGNQWVSAIEIQSMLRQLMYMIDDPQRWGVLFDTRGVVGRNDPEFEREANQLREFILEHFARIAVLVRTMAGEMQVTRFLDRKARMLVFRDPEQALAFAAGEALE